MLTYRTDSTGSRVVHNTTPIPAGIANELRRQSPANADALAILATKTLLLTSMTIERRSPTLRHWIEMPYQYWRAQLGNDYCATLDLAECLGLIERNHHYSDGSQVEAFSKSVRLSQQYIRPRIIEWELTEPSHRKAIREFEAKNLGMVGSWLTGKLASFALPENARIRNVWDGLSVSRWRAGDVYSMRCSYGRLHTNLTSISRGLRETLNLRSTNGFFHTLDIKNSQLLILGLAAAHNTQIQHTAAQDTAGQSGRNTICLPSVAMRGGGIGEWISLCESGIAYEYLLSEVRARRFAPYEIEYRNKSTGRLRTQLIDPSTWDRKAIKQAFLVCMFATLDDTVANPLFGVIRDIFPAIADYIVAIKSDSHRHLAHICQSLESRLMIDDVGTRLMREHWDLPCFTIHDAYVVPEWAVASVMQTIQAVYAAHGISPAIDSKPNFKGESL